jgi:hypothetical protein
MVGRPFKDARLFASSPFEAPGRCHPPNVFAPERCLSAPSANFCSDREACWPLSPALSAPHLDDSGRGEK